jgi:hypothetical protein
MAFGLEPLVRGWGIRKGLVIVTFLGSMVLAAMILGATLGWLGEPLLLGETARALLVLGASALALLVELRLVSFGAPYRHWQVPRDWPGRFGMFRGYALWGAALGVGVISYVPFASYHVLLVWMLASGGAVAGAVMGAAYGVGRGLASLAPAVAAARRPGRLLAVAGGALGRHGAYQAIQTLALSGIVVAVLAFGL